MTHRLRVLVAVALAGTAFLAACGGGNGDDGSEPTATDTGPAQAAPTATPTPGKHGARGIGDAIGGLYVDAMTKITALMEDRPPAAELMPKAQELKEEYIEQLVELGRQREVLSDADRAILDSRAAAALGKLPTAALTAFAEGQAYYEQSGEEEMADLIADFNIITKYAFFDLLKQQEPDEAERLGIK